MLWVTVTERCLNGCPLCRMCARVRSCVRVFCASSCSRCTHPKLFQNKKKKKSFVGFICVSDWSTPALPAVSSSCSQLLQQAVPCRAVRVPPPRFGLWQPSTTARPPASAAVEGLSPRSVFDIRKMLLARFRNAVMGAVESTEVKEQEMGTLAASQNVV